MVLQPVNSVLVPHVLQAFYLVLDEAAAALDRAGQLLSEHLG
jgi:hypothetical protein